jgi:D-glycerate 3-kinase
LRDWLTEFQANGQLPGVFVDIALAICEPLAAEVQARADRPGYLVGICGAQGSGKSTLTAVLAEMLRRRGLIVAVISLDDLYLSRGTRADLGRSVHPLFVTRGVPGTHDVELGRSVLGALGNSGDVALPRFDKAIDDRAAQSTWPVFAGSADVVLFEGWCVGARPQSPEALANPLNQLERDEDPNGTWRSYANDALAGPYRALFDPLDMLILLEAPSFDVVLDWRLEQERKLRNRIVAGGGDVKRTMSDEAVVRFIAHYERMTRWILQEMPGRADLVVRLDGQRNLV